MTELMHDIFSTDVAFSQMGLNDELLRALRERNFQHPTHAQAKIMPVALSGRDVLGQAKTGTGKTAAFGLPILQLINRDEPFSALILVPTRELCMQVAAELHELGRHTQISIAKVYGGQRIKLQAEKLQKNPHIIVGTPGRVMDMHHRGLLPYDRVRFAVLDEVDRMLDIGFRDDIRRILGNINQPHQTIFVSATISPEIDRLARTYMREPEHITVSADRSLTVSQVHQVYFSVQPWDKNRLLVHLLTHEEPALTLVFCKTKHTVDALTDFINRKGIEAHAIHGDMYQGKRNRIISKLREGDLSVLVASDLVARGLDVDDISHVINYDLPEDPEIYVHRIGRTARAGRGGIAWAFVTPDQGDLLTAIEHLTNVEIPRNEYPDFEPGPVPQDVLARRQREVERQAELKVVHSRVAKAPPQSDEAADATKFPGGVVPTAVPGKRLGGRVRTSRR